MNPQTETRATPVAGKCRVSVQGTCVEEARQFPSAFFFFRAKTRALSLRASLLQGVLGSYGASQVQSAADRRGGI